MSLSWCIQVAKVGLDFESEKSHTLTVKITGDDAEDKTAQITITVTDIDDTAPTNITLSNRDIASNAVIAVSIFVKLFLILVLHLRQFFIVRIFVKRATGKEILV